MRGLFRLRAAVFGCFAFFWAFFASFSALGEAYEDYPLQSVTLFGFEALEAEFRALTEPLLERRFDLSELRGAVAEIERQYRAAGYRFARAAPVKARLLKGMSPGYHATIRMDEGAVDSIAVEGLDRTREDVIRNQLLLVVGKAYQEEDREESERILRAKPYIGSAEITAEARPPRNRVAVRVKVEELWGLVPRFRLVDTGADSTLHAFLRGEIGFLMNVTDSNFLGSGQRWRAQYRWDAERVNAETGRVEGGRSRTGIQMSDPNLFGSRWQFAGEYFQQPLTDIDSWEASLSLPFYSLRARWAASLSAYDFGRLSDFRQNGVLVRQRERHFIGQSASLTRAFGEPSRQLLGTLALRRIREDTRLILPAAEGVERSSRALIGGRFSARSIRFAQYRNLDRMGKVEDVALGHALRFGLDLGLRALTNDENELRPSLSYRMSRRAGAGGLWQCGVVLDGAARLDGGGLDDGSALASARLFLRSGPRRSTLVRVFYESRYRPRRELNLLLGGEFGVRGYGIRAFDGQSRAALNVEARQMLMERPLFSAMGALFYDHGYIWWDRPFSGGAARGVGVGLRIGASRIAQTPVLRADLAYGLDADPRRWTLHFATGHHF